MTSLLQNYGPVDAPYNAVPALSANGRYLATASNKSLLVRDLSDGTVRTLAAPAESLAGITSLSGADLSSNGQFAAAIVTYSGTMRLALFDLTTGTSRLVPVTLDGKSAVVFNSSPSISGDGRYIAINANLNDVVVIDTQTGLSKKIGADQVASLPALKTAPKISDDGSTLFYDSVSTGVVAYGTMLQSVKLATGVHTLVNGKLDDKNIDKLASHADVSADGRYVVWDSLVSKIDADANLVRDVYLTDTSNGTVTLVSKGPSGGSDGAISADGRYVTFTSSGGDVAPGSIAGVESLYRKDLTTGDITLLSGSSSKLNDISPAALSADGSVVVYVQHENNAHVGQWVAKTGDTGTAANEVFVASTGNQTLDGGAGRDTVAYHGARSEYTVTRSSVNDKTVARDGSDVLAGIERLQFADGNVALDVDGVAGQAFRVYQAAFNRAPDQAGLGYWISQMDKGLPALAVAGNFAISAEFTALYGANPAAADVVAKLYNNVLHRAGDAAGVAYWTDVLSKNPGALPTVLYNFSESAENVAALVGVMENGVAYMPFL